MFIVRRKKRNSLTLKNLSDSKIGLDIVKTRGSGLQSQGHELMMEVHGIKGAIRAERLRSSRLARSLSMWVVIFWKGMGRCSDVR